MTYRDISVKQYEAIRELADEQLSDLDTQTALLSILFEKTEDEILDLPMEKYQKLAHQAKFILTPPQPNKKVPKRLKINGKKYYILADVNKMSAGQFIDYQSFVKSGTDKHLHNILSCFIIPIGKTYGKDYDPMEVAGEIRDHLDIETAYSLLFFYQMKSKKSLLHTLHYSEAMAMMLEKTGKKRMRPMMRELKMKMRQMIGFLKSGVG